MTRARAAAKEAAVTTQPKPKSKATTKVATTTTKATTKTTAKPTTKAAKPTAATTASAATARTTATTATVASTTRATSNKRKTRSDEEEEPAQQQQSTMNKPPARGRGRPKKIVADPTPSNGNASEPETEPETEAEESSTTTKTRATRGRTKKATTAEPAKTEPAKTTRTRTRKTVTEEKTADDGSSEPAKKVPRRRAAASVKESQGTITTTCSTNPTPGLKSAVSRPASRVNGVMKKTVTFQEPEKENRVPVAAAKPKEKTVEMATGMRAKPVRKPAAGGRTTRAAAKSTSTTTEEKNQKSPLSPKKDGHNIPISRDADSDDELATLEKTPLKPLLKSPIKPPPRRIEPEPEPTSTEKGEGADQSSEPTTSAILTSPVRRIPPSPWKDSMKSPAKRVDAIPSLILSATKQDSQSVLSPAKSTILQSPAKRAPMPIMALQPPFGADASETKQSPLKMSLLQSPAKRPASPVKMQSGDDQSARLLFAPKSSPVKEQAEEEIPQDVPQDSPQAAPQDNPEDTAHEVPQDLSQEVPAEVTTAEPKSEDAVDEVPVAEEFNFASSIQLEFPGRLSAVLPRHADPALKEKPSPSEDVATQQEVTVEPEQPTVVEPEAPAKVEEQDDDAMELDELETVAAEAAASSPTKITPPQSPSKGADQEAWSLRAKDLKDECMSDSEDELASSGKAAFKHQEDTMSSFSALPATPTPAGLRTPKNGLPSSAVKAASRAIRSVSKGPKLTFTPLSAQLGEWKAASPLKRSTATPSQVRNQPKESEEGNSLVEVEKETFFNDEMAMRDKIEKDLETLLMQDIAASYGDTHLSNEDVELAAEAHEMSLLDHAGIHEMGDTNRHDDSISDASQEYGDENAVPIDPALLNSTVGCRNSNPPPVTPMRPAPNRNFHTVSKVPLKAADDSPQTFNKRCASASKLPPKRSLGHSRNATVTSFVPIKDSSEMDVDMDYNSGAAENPPVTPAKSDIWSAIGTPARTPRRDLNPALLRGAVVFVDVHTSEGADASPVFVELLSQMGARCVKSWPWNPNSNSADVDVSSKIGITHVVYKDGGKRTMEKVRESNGVVQCVGVGWVLE